MTSESVRVASMLMRMAADFDREANLWREYPRMSKRLREASQLITDAARHVLRTDAANWGEHWHAAATLTLSQIHMVRLFRDGSWESTARR